MNSVKKSINVSPILNPGTLALPPPPPPYLNILETSIPPGINKVLHTSCTLFPFSPNCQMTPKEILGEHARNEARTRETRGDYYGVYRAEITAPNPSTRGAPPLKQIVTIHIRDNGDNLTEHQKGLCELNLVIQTKHPYFKNQQVSNVVKLT